MNASPSKLLGVQYMRALASGMVLFGHVLAETEHYLKIDMPFGWVPWTRGVDIFFVISGFIILVSSQKYFEAPGGVRVFCRKRFTRVVPLYWLFTTLMLAVLLILPSGAKQTQLDWGQVITSYLFIPYERYDGRAAPILSLGWTLNFEIFFYAVFALALFLPRRIGPLSVVVLMTVWAALGALIPGMADITVLRVWSNPLILEFCMGVLLGQLYVHHSLQQQDQPEHNKARNRVGWALLATGFGLLCLLNQIDGLPRWIASGFPATMMVASIVFFYTPHNEPGRWARIGGLLGDSSYALYLSHRFFLRALTMVIVPLLPATITGGLLFTGVACSVAIAGSLVVYVWIERPLLRLTSGKPR
ncbi:acyltransferase [uncultured Pelagimonas sp.]|uniref:acyltransferase family protein n=1 Tax=uncultured Pelagimonas sp. TaxID=1618102 RepID=UPI00261CABB0|nr:acyltransferase [uncultured Pelagimonas sp.]